MSSLSPENPGNAAAAVGEASGGDVRGMVVEVVKLIVDQPDEVEVEESKRSGERDGMELSLRVAQKDVGKVIGKQGRTIRSLRNLVQAAGMKQNRHYSLEIIEDEDSDQASGEGQDAGEDHQ